MMHQAAIPLGQSPRILADSADDGAAVVAHDVVVGDFRDLADLRRFAVGCDVITFDHEHVPAAHIRALVADGATVLPSADALRFAQDKAAMRERLGGLGLPCPAWTRLAPGPAGDAAVDALGAQHGWPVVLKAISGGYDGKGVWMVATPAQARAVIAEAQANGIDLMAEQAVSIVRELAAVVARSPFGQGAAWPVVETVQVEGICVEVLAPAPGLAPAAADEAQKLALRIAVELDVVGVLAVELFETADGSLIINELAMRPHNSGHWTIEGSRTSQFEQHLRAILDWPLGPTEPTAAVAVMANVVGGPSGDPRDRQATALGAVPGAHLHLYGKQARPARKIGHVTVLGDELTPTRSAANLAADLLAGTAREAPDMGGSSDE